MLALRWIAEFFRSRLGRAVVAEVVELVDPSEEVTPLPFSAVERQRAQAASAAHAYPPTLPPPKPPGRL